HDRKLPGRPDLVFPKHKALIFVNGCFWHGHDCALFKWPKTRKDFWRDKIDGNVVRDHRNLAVLAEADWRVALIWECALKGKQRLQLKKVFDILSVWIEGDLKECVIQGHDQETKETLA
ncbi:unnamed protein product, partial [Ectocarpus sp. 12 AP-2014]